MCVFFFRAQQHMYMQQLHNDVIPVYDSVYDKQQTNKQTNKQKEENLLTYRKNLTACTANNAPTICAAKYMINCCFVITPLYKLAIDAAGLYMFIMCIREDANNSNPKVAPTITPLAPLNISIITSSNVPSSSTTYK